MSETKTIAGSCHCGAVRWEVDLNVAEPVNRCNCGICVKTQIANAIVKPSAFRLLAGEDSLTDYQRLADSPSHFPFCKVCGVRGFGRGSMEQLGGDYVAVNTNCLDDLDPLSLKFIHWDGRHNNWQAGPRPEPWPLG